MDRFAMTAVAWAFAVLIVSCGGKPVGSSRDEVGDVETSTPPEDVAAAPDPADAPAQADDVTASLDRATVEFTGSFWPQWRGPLGTGVSLDADPPLEWSENSNIKWKALLPGRGHSSPVVWKDRVFVTSAVETDGAADPDVVKAVESQTPEFHRAKAHMPEKVLRFVVIALDRADGTVVWERTVNQSAPHAATHADGSWASSSPLTDGVRVYAYFGSYGLYCLGMDGEVQWEKQFGPLKMKANFGEGTSPALCGDTLVLSQDQEDQSFIVALDKKTGAERWRADRDEGTSWATPLVVEQDGRTQVITSATTLIRSYDAATGTVLWEIGGMTGNVIPSPVANDGIVVCMSGFRGNALVAVKLSAARGDAAQAPGAVAWTSVKDTPYTPSPLLYDGLLYYLKGNDAMLTCANAATGEAQLEAVKLEGVGMTYASPVAAAGRVYVTGRKGLTVVIKSGQALEVLARNQLDDSFTASAALAGSEVYLRGYEKLYCIAAE
jgi:outer membrane protein assembly factor BamB